MSNSIQKTVIVKAPVARVWQALTDHREFGAWFGATLDKPFTIGAIVNGAMTQDACAAGETAATKAPLRILVREMAPTHRFAYSWHPFSEQKDVDFATEPMTDVVFTLAETEAGTVLTVTESGFDALPEGRRDIAFRMHEGGWTFQLGRVQAYSESARHAA